MSRSGRTVEFMRAWREGRNAEHVKGCGEWGSDDCDRCTADIYDEWEAFLHACHVAGFERPSVAASLTTEDGKQ